MTLPQTPRPRPAGRGRTLTTLDRAPGPAGQHLHLPVAALRRRRPQLRPDRRLHAPSYVVQAADVGASVTLRVAVTATNVAGPTRLLSPTAGTASRLPTNLTKPTISAAQPKAFPAAPPSARRPAPGPASRRSRHLPVAVLRLPDAAAVRGHPARDLQLLRAVAATTSASALQVVVTATNASGSGTATSRVLVPGHRRAARNTVSPRILAGTIEVGSTLTADTGTWSGSTPFHYTYQWRGASAVGEPARRITGATASSYLLQPSDHGSTIVFKVTATNGGGAGVGQSNHTLPILPEDALRPREHRSADARRQAGHRLDARRHLGCVDRRAAAHVHVHLAALRRDRAGLHRDPERRRHAYKLKLADVGYTIKFLVTGRNAVGGRDRQLRPDRRDHPAAAPAEGTQDRRHQEERLPRGRRRATTRSSGSAATTRSSAAAATTS